MAVVLFLGFFGLFVSYCPEFAPTMHAHRYFLIPYSFFVLCCLRRCLSRCKHCSKGSQVPACLRVDRPELKSQLCNLLAVELWTSCTTSLGRSFFTCKMGIRTLPCPRVVMRAELHNIHQGLSVLVPRTPLSLLCFPS